MELDEKLRLLQRDKRFLEEELKNKRDLVDAIHKEASFPLYKQLWGTIHQLQLSIDAKALDIKSLQEANGHGD